MITTHQKELVTTTIMIDDVEVNIDGYVHYYVDKNYGADADGNRGQVCTFIDDVTDVSAYLDDVRIELSPRDLQRATVALGNLFLEGR